MIGATQRGVVLVALGAPLALAVALIAPGAWTLGLAWTCAVVAAILFDAWSARAIHPAQMELDCPAAIGVGDTLTIAPAAAGGAARSAVEATPPLVPADPPTGVPVFHAARRGTATLRRVWVRRTGPMGLGWRQRARTLDRTVRILPDIRPVRDNGMRQFLQSTQAGARLRDDGGDGQEFQRLTAYQPGMSRRAIDWKASARHMGLLAREYRPERDHSVVFAIDAGRAMSDPVDGVPRIDRAVSAALLAAFVALKSGDRVRLFSFADKPQVDTGTLAGSAAFARLHDAAATIDYGREDANYTLSLVTLDERLSRRSLVILFTELTDPTAAELMLAAAARMLKRHRVLFVLLGDPELDALIDAEPVDGDTIVRATIAHTLKRERRIVAERLRRLGVAVLEAGSDDMALALVERYAAERARIA